MAAAVATMMLKFLAWYLTGSIGLYSDALESVVNLCAATLGFFLLGLAAQPADNDHPFGHEKAEYFSSGAEGMMILIAALLIIWKAINAFIHPAPLAKLDIGLIISLLATGINAAAAAWLLRVAHQEKSLAVEADAKHLLTDVWTSLGLLLALALMLAFPEATWLDPLIALLVAANIIRTGFDLMRRSFDGLMDKQLPPAILENIENQIKHTLPNDTYYCNLRTRQAGSRHFIEFNLHVPGEWPVSHSHQLCDDLENALQKLYEESETTIHVEPLQKT
jgi:cation diffusion facilitator family transporter